MFHEILHLFVVPLATQLMAQDRKSQISWSMLDIRSLALLGCYSEQILVKLRCIQNMH